MSAFALILALFASPLAVPCHDPTNLPTIVVEPSFAPNITCSQCISFVNTLKNETEFLSKVATDIEFVCGKIFGPTAHQCVTVTDDIKRGLDYLSKHNATQLCQDLHYCHQLI